MRRATADRLSATYPILPSADATCERPRQTTTRRRPYNRNRQQRVHVAQPPSAQALHVKFLEQTDAGANEYRIYNRVDNGAARREARQPGKQRKDCNRQQDRGQLSAGGNRNASGSEFHRLHPLSWVVII